MNNSAHRQTLGDLLRRSRRRMPDKTALQCGDVSWSFAELDDICNQLASGLTASGVSLGDRVAVLSRNSHSFAALRFALARIGAVIVPVNFMLNAAEVSFILQHSGAKMLCTDSEMAELGQQASEGLSIDSWLWLPGEQPSARPPGFLSFEELLQCGDQPSPVNISESTLAQIIYTSGTESRPKGAMLTHGAVISEYVTCLVDAEIAEGDRLLHALPLYHCAQLDVFLGPGVYVGASGVITAAPSADNLLHLIEHHQITSFFAPPTVWIGMLRSPKFDSSDLRSLQKGYYGASIMPVEVLKELQQRLPAVRLWNLYGQTEIAPVATVLKPEDQFRKAGSAGKPGLNIETRIVDEQMNDVATGEVGEIVHRSPQLLSGYYNDQEKTSEAFHGGWFHSGDLATIDDEGYITVVDRKKDMIKTGGENVASREVEEIIYAMDAVSEVAVIGLQHPRWVEAVTAFVVVKPGYNLAENQVREYCSQHLASYKQPKAVILCESLPKNPSGKILKRTLRSEHQQVYS